MFLDARAGYALGFTDAQQPAYNFVISFTNMHIAITLAVIQIPTIMPNKARPE
jgi:hypothetical protein